MTASIESIFKRIAPACDFCSFRMVEETAERLTVQQNVAEPPAISVDRGVMITVIDRGGLGYAATSDITEAGLRAAALRARDWAHLSAQRSVANYSAIIAQSSDFAHAKQLSGQYQTKVAKPANALTLKEKLAHLMQESQACKIDDRIVDWSASFWTTNTRQLYVTADGGMVSQNFDFMVPALSVTAFANGEAQTRSFGGRYNGFCQQGGLEILARSGFYGAGQKTASEALQLLSAPNCPTGKMDVILMPDQMMLQIHESIGHPLELDRILGDERNYAGTSFVTLDMFGSYQYGSPLLNVTYDPTIETQFASFAYDDDGSPATREFIIKEGILQRPLGGAISQARANMPGVATTRACAWNRPPIDRMSNLNIENGDMTIDDMVASIEDGVLMRTNVSWSIDDSRNKFQFGCELGQRIKDGKLGEIVKNPNYRGISATFWRSLSGVGNADTQEVMGTPYCGKGEPNQVIRVGHASPACKFSAIDVFGGEG
jgi:predicted Zn-dependent protease